MSRLNCSHPKKDYWGDAQGNTARTFARQSAPPLRLARGDAGDGCQHEEILVPRSLSELVALDSAYLPTPITVSAAMAATTSLRCWSQRSSRAVTLGPRTLSGVTLAALGPENSMSGQWLTRKTCSKIVSAVP